MMKLPQKVNSLTINTSTLFCIYRNCSGINAQTFYNHIQVFSIIYTQYCSQALLKTNRIVISIVIHLHLPANREK